MARGGSRPGAGRPQGTTGIKQAQTLSKEAAREILRQRVLRDMEPMVAAQIAHAQGISHFMLRDPKTGKFERLTELAQIEAALNAEDAEEGSTYYIWTKDPSVQAFTDLMNRALDKPKEQIDLQVSGEVELVERLAKARDRVKR
jgi:hypothetical protein